MNIFFKFPGRIVIILTLLLFFSCGIKRQSGFISNFDELEKYEFPKGFLWGTSTAAEQMEETPDSDWGKFIQDAYKNKRFDTIKPGIAKQGHIRNLGNYSEEIILKKTNHNAMFKEDIAMIKEMKHNSYRFSIAWDRIFPRPDMDEPDPKAVKFYKDLILELKKNNIKPLVTLFHFSSPAWFWEEKDGKVGWERDDAIPLFEKFMKVVLENYGADVDHWCTLNEPMVFLFGGYMQGVFPPLMERKEVSEIAFAMSRLLEAHALSYKMIKENDKKTGLTSEIGFTMHTRAFEPYRNYAILDRIIAEKIEQAFIWDFIDAIKTGTLKVSGTDFSRDIEGLKDSLDYLGINYYGRYYVKSNIFDPKNYEVLFADPDTKKELINDLGWEAYPLGFSYILNKSYEKYKLPIYILESGTADAQDNDTIRQGNLVTHIAEIWKVNNEKTSDVRGYIHWSLIDNFEWAEGFEARFGLVKVDYKNHYKRIPRPSAELFTKIIDMNGFTKEILDTYSK
ncbi:MAG: glycoside hydrolase family 1 protein, partial [Leptospiraceae bacterium]|nr:glycoside hydrolase family 1 protein [Leptospiraceae bacterium]